MYKKLFILLCFISSLSTNAFAEPSVQPKVTYHKIQNSSLNEEELKKHLGKEDPRRLPSLVALGMVSLREDKPKQADIYFKQALSEMPPTVLNKLYEFECYEGLAVSATRRLQYTEGKRYFQKAFQLTPYLPPITHPMVSELYGYYGQSLLETGYLDEARTIIQQSLKLDSTCKICHHAEQYLQLDLNSPDYFDVQGDEIIRWADDKTVINVFIEDGSTLKDWNPDYIQLAKKALMTWQTTSNNRFRFQMVSQPEQSDVTIHWSLNTMVENGETVIGLAHQEVTGEYISNKDIYICLHDNPNEIMNTNLMYSTLLHEVGHMLGISEHSPNPADVMSPVSGRQVVTGRDIATLMRIYETEANYVNPPGISVTEYRQQIALPDLQNQQ